MHCAIIDAEMHIYPEFTQFLPETCGLGNALYTYVRCKGSSLASLPSFPHSRE